LESITKQDYKIGRGCGEHLWEREVDRGEEGRNIVDGLHIHKGNRNM
jgi:hypothetical protein